MTTCAEPAEFCLGDHIRPRLDGWHANGSKPGHAKARCPACGRQSLALRPGDKGARIVWYCHVGCDWHDVRTAMIRRGVPDGCLPTRRAQRTEDELMSRLAAIFDSQDYDPAVYLLLIGAEVFNDGRMPHGHDLEALADRIGMSCSSAYRARSRVVASCQSDRSRSGCVAARAGCQSDSSGCQSDSSRSVLTSGFVVDATPVIENSVDGLTPITAPLRVVASSRECAMCGCALDADRRADALYCTPRCAQRARRARRAARDD